MNASAEAFNREAGLVVEQSNLNVRRLRLVEQAGDQATVDLDATVAIHARTVSFSSTMYFRFTGPVRLTRCDGAWLVESIVIDRLRHPENMYAAQPVSDDVHAFLAPRGSAVVVDIAAGESSILVEDVTVAYDAWRLLPMRFGSTRVPVRLEPGQRFIDYLFLGGVSARTALAVVVTTDRGMNELTFAPPRIHIPLRRRLMPVWSVEGALYLLLLLGLADWFFAGGKGFAGLALGLVGSIAVVRSARLVLLSFLSPWAAFLGLAGAFECALGIVLMLHSGLGWFGALGVVGTMVFAMLRSLQTAHAAGSARRGLRRHGL